MGDPGASPSATSRNAGSFSSAVLLQTGAQRQPRPGARGPASPPEGSLSMPLDFVGVRALPKPRRHALRRDSPTAIATPARDLHLSVPWKPSFALVIVPRAASADDTARGEHQSRGLDHPSGQEGLIQRQGCSFRGFTMPRKTLETESARIKNGSAAPHELVSATRAADVISLPKRRCLAIDGMGSPKAPPFAQAIGALYGVAYALKFSRKKGGRSDFKVAPLEGRWWAEGAPARSAAPSPTSPSCAIRTRRVPGSRSPWAQR
jgi:hypothetical protein